MNPDASWDTEASLCLALSSEGIPLFSQAHFDLVIPLILILLGIQDQGFDLVFLN